MKVLFCADFIIFADGIFKLKDIVSINVANYTL